MSEREQLIIRKMTAAMRRADAIHRYVGGGTRHYVRDCLLPILGGYGLSVVTEDEKARADLAAERERELVDALIRARDALYEAGRPDSNLDRASAIAVADICAARINKPKPLSQWLLEGQLAKLNARENSDG